jgi:hypothetical protein
MKTVVVVGAIAVAVLAPATAKANNTGVARQRMTKRLFAERRSEVSYKDAGDPASGLVYLEEVETREGRYSSWRPAKLAVSCRDNRCSGQLVVDNEDGGPVGENGPVGETYVALEDHGTFRGPKGTYHETGWEPPS